MSQYTKRKAALLLLAGALLGGCTANPAYEYLLERASVRPGNAYLIERSVGESGVRCRYSDGTGTASLNITTRCF